MFEKYRVLIIGSLIFLFVLGILFFLLFKKSIIFEVNDNNEDIVEVNSNYEVPSIKACYGNKFKCTEVDVEAVSDVDIKVLGSYKV